MNTLTYLAKFRLLKYYITDNDLIHNKNKQSQTENNVNKQIKASNFKNIRIPLLLKSLQFRFTS